MGQIFEGPVEAPFTYKHTVETQTIKVDLRDFKRKGLVLVNSLDLFVAKRGFL